MSKGKILVTGAAGFIGYHLSHLLLAEGYEVVGIDNFTTYYDVNLKRDRLAQLTSHPLFLFSETDIAKRGQLDTVFEAHRFKYVVNLAAQAGVRYSLECPEAYIDSNLVGFGNILEACRHHRPEHLVYASSSSVYGMNTTMPFSIHHSVDHPISLYAATKKANELMAHTYSYLYRLPTTGLRFFTVYGPWGRPDMAIFLFTKAILKGTPIDVFNYGEMNRDFTYIDDIVEGVSRVLTRPAQPNAAWSGGHPDPGSSSAPYRLYNIGNHQPVSLMRFIEAIEEALGKKAIKNMMPLQPGDVLGTEADATDLKTEFGFLPTTKIEDGVSRFVDWYRMYYKNEL